MGRISEGSSGAKLHLVLDPDAGLPLYLEVTSGGSTTSRRPRMPIEAGATYVFDLGYYDFAFWAASTHKAAASSRG